MLKYSIEVQCDLPSCNARKTIAETVEQPTQSAIPTLDRWSGPFSDWRFGTGKYNNDSGPTLCPVHRQEAEAQETEEAARRGVEEASDAS